MKSRDLGLLAVMAGLGYVAVMVLPPGDQAGELWPTGLAAGRPVEPPAGPSPSPWASWPWSSS